MRLSEVIFHLEKVKEEQGDVNVCIYNPNHSLPCESFIFTMKEDAPFIPFCEDRVCCGTYLHIE